MTETDYIKATNLAKVTNAKKILDDILNCEEYGIDKNKLAVVFNKLDEIETDLRKSIILKGE